MKFCGPTRSDKIYAQKNAHHPQNGAKQRAAKRTRQKTKIVSAHKQQEEMFKHILEGWMEKNNQIDDILLMGFIVFPAQSNRNPSTHLRVA